MPKIIKDVEKTIKNCAFNLFTEFSYIDVDMKMISEKSGIAVGTLYNYYKNKRQLYISILKESWQSTFDKLDTINGLDIPLEDKLKKLISTLYEDIELRNGLGKALINNSIVELKDDKEISDLKKILISKVENFLNYINKIEALNKYSKIDTKLAELLLVSIMTMFELHPNDKEDNINFLTEFICLSIK